METNGIFVKAPLIVNYIDSALIRKDVKRAKELGADYIVCNMHWGTEYKPLPNDYQKRYESFCYELGVDMVIGNHPHVVQPIEKKKIGNEDKLTVWSLGNFVSNMQVRYTRGGVMLGAHIQKVNNTIRITKAEDWLVYVHKKQEGKVMQYYILPDFNYNDYRDGFLTSSDLQKMEEFFSDSRTLYAQHNKDVQERKVSDNTAFTSLYKKYLTSYYAVQLSNGKEGLLNSPSAGQYLHQTVDLNGKRYILSGVCENLDQAKGHARFIRDCKLDDELSIVKVYPNRIETVIE
jgi:hypothetical protein